MQFKKPAQVAGFFMPGLLKFHILLYRQVMTYSYVFISRYGPCQCARPF